MAGKTRKEATKKAIYEAKVQQAGQLGEDVSEFVFEEGMSVVERVMGDFVERVTANIDNEKNFVTTGAINKLELKAESGVISVMAHPHLVYQDRGVNGSRVKLFDTPHSYHDKKPPVGVFREWIKNKQIFLTEKNDYHRKMDDRLSKKERTEDRPFKELTEDEQIDQAAYAMREKVYQEGFKPRHIYSKEIPKLVEDLGAALNDFCIQQIHQLINIQPREGGGKRVIVKP
ncbi:MAG: hypothetical protein EOO97_00130 [Pedobacter sp.]|nr:MAG: hypothetical protein EOO97_00130 [Pedobacter sp.]